VTASEASARARLLLVRGEEESALAAVEAALALEPDHVGALLLKAELLLLGREGDAALGLHQRVTELLPRSSETWNALARCRHALGDDRGALQAAEEARRLLGEGDNFLQAGPVYLTLLWCLREMRRYQEALDMAEEGLARVPDAILAQWAATVAEELAEAEKERC
jgi:tetratricopeptide (TPR) repeat protein